MAESSALPDRDRERMLSGTLVLSKPLEREMNQCPHSYTDQPFYCSTGNAICMYVCNANLNLRM